ncbi:carotenoid oxygenase family protein [Ralstonia pseudosolanacearum]|uniref:carotenoid oxygenase family protein n=1 Tax=Ralstonia pseudosolanacearum TaxID=1310165 RepID=UPI0018679258|nr:carotenoid oxygenase family protein [Ralstonia pseudosolanacearum]QOK94074.1 hypothetical protein HF908_21740 [Ralstonia pseudosolanacearum]UWD88106.1 carotenoid oxygenase family protein [Ralstonia pseudosolanacearum]CAH0442634.1 hypothetical protein LMG9673_03449 [Ralstonia pseudosolanacearum]
MERRSFLTAAGLGLAAPFGLTLRDVMAMATESPDAWAAGFAAARAERAWLAGFEGVSADLPPATLTLDLRSGRAGQTATPHVAEFPKIDTRRTGLRHRALFCVANAASRPGADSPIGFDTLMRFDTESGHVQRYRFAQRALVEEHLFVPAGPNAPEGEGWLLGTVFDVEAGRTLLTVFDARNVSAGPVAVAARDGVVPMGFHGLFRPRVAA